MAETKIRSGGIGMAGLLTVVFVTAKVFGVMPVAGWSWWWVLCPLWISLAIGLGIFIIGMIGVFLYFLWGHRADRKKKRYRYRVPHDWRF